MATFQKISAASGGEAMSDLIRPQMTSLIDILTLLLVFLIQSFNAEGTLVTQAPDLELPLSSSQIAPRPALTLEVTRSDIVAEGRKLASLESFKSSKSLLIENVFHWLRTKAAADSTMHNPIIIQCDREIPFNIVKRVMHTCSKAGFNDFSVLVVED